MRADSLVSKAQQGVLNGVCILPCHCRSGDREGDSK